MIHCKLYANQKIKWESHKNLGFTHFYFLPSIEYFRDKTFDEDGDCSFNIDFSWLFFNVTLTVYWGSAYEKTILMK